MDTATVQAWASLVAAAVGLAAILASFALERQRRADARRDRLIDARRAACVELLAAQSEIARVSESFILMSALQPDDTHWVAPPAHAANRAAMDLELAAPGLLLQATALGKAALGLAAVATMLAQAPRDPLKRKQADQAKQVWDDARAAFVEAALNELGTAEKD